MSAGNIARGSCAAGDPLSLSKGNSLEMRKLSGEVDVPMTSKKKRKIVFEREANK
jgi:hypothetical protein